MNDGMHDEPRRKPLTFGEKFFLGALILISALWGVLLWKIVGWLVLWIREVLKCF
jgi:hypothetical protein